MMRSTGVGGSIVLATIFCACGCARECPERAGTTARSGTGAPRLEELSRGERQAEAARRTSGVAVALQGEGPGEPSGLTPAALDCLPLTTRERAFCYIEATGGIAPSEVGLSNLILAYHLLGERGIAARLGRRYLERYPPDTPFGSQIRTAINRGFWVTGASGSPADDQRLRVDEARRRREEEERRLASEAAAARERGGSPPSAETAPRGPRDCLPLTSAARAQCYLDATGGVATGEAGLRNLIVACELLRNRRCSRALGREYLEKYPDSPLAPRVRRLIGE